jgi:hypothetical protein
VLYALDALLFEVLAGLVLAPAYFPESVIHLLLALVLLGDHFVEDFGLVQKVTLDIDALALRDVANGVLLGFLDLDFLPLAGNLNP